MADQQTFTDPEFRQLLEAQARAARRRLEARRDIIQRFLRRDEEDSENQAVAYAAVTLIRETLCMVCPACAQHLQDFCDALDSEHGGPDQ